MALRFHIFGFLVLMLSTTGAHLHAGEVTNPSALRKIEVVLDALTRCPSWSQPDVNSNAIISVCRELAKFETDVLRRAVERFVEQCKMQKSYDVASMSKLFVLNRYIFQVPPKEAFSGPFFGGWDGVPYDQHQMNMLWPLSTNAAGELVLTGKYAGYAGEPFGAIAEFDYFLKKYGRRKPIPAPAKAELQ